MSEDSADVAGAALDMARSLSAKLVNRGIKQLLFSYNLSPFLVEGVLK